MMSPDMIHLAGIGDFQVQRCGVELLMSRLSEADSAKIHGRSWSLLPWSAGLVEVLATDRRSYGSIELLRPTGSRGRIVVCSSSPLRLLAEGVTRISGMR